MALKLQKHQVLTCASLTHLIRQMNKVHDKLWELFSQRLFYITMCWKRVTLHWCVSAFISNHLKHGQELLFALEQGKPEKKSWISIPGSSIAPMTGQAPNGPPTTSYLDLEPLEHAHMRNTSLIPHSHSFIKLKSPFCPSRRN